MQQDNWINKLIESIATSIDEMANLPQLDEKECNYLYNLAVEKCQIGDLSGATNLFQYLVLTDRTNKLYIKSLAGCLHGLKRYAEAKEFYELVYLFDADTEYDCLFYCADCTINLGLYADAKKYLDKYLQLSKDEANPENNSQMIKRAKLQLAIVETKLQ